VVTASVTGFGRAVPPAMDQAGLWDQYFSTHYAGSRLAERIWAASGIERRHGVVDPRLEDVSGWSTGARMQRFLTDALPLGSDAVTTAIKDAGITPDDVDLLTVVSCTGYGTPGVDILLARDLGMPASVQRLNIGHMGCYAALPGLSTVSDATVARGLTSVLLCLELPSLHVQPASDEAQQMVAHSLFSDAAAAVVLQPDTEGFEVLRTVARTDVANADHMTWDITDLGFKMGLSPKVPDVLAVHVEDVVTELLDGLPRDEVQGWAIHPGGPRIVDVCEERLGLAPEQTASSRRTLRDYGNCSSATVLMVLDDLQRSTPVASGGHVVMLAFGPGLTLYGTLLRRR
jgi:alkylresorcinol/alkylpyrone synthase